MKKLPLILFSVLALLNAHAQYNKTYDLNANDDLIEHGRVIQTSHEEIVFTACSYRASSNNKYAIVTKTDNLGNVLWDRTISPANLSTERIMDTYAIVETEDYGYLVGGYCQTDALTGGTVQPIVFKLDVNGNLMWSKVYRINYSLTPNFLGKASLQRVVDDYLDEHYFFVTSACSDQRSIDDVVSIIKMDEHGSLIWSKKYYDVVASQFSRLCDIPGDIAYHTDSRTYMICGARQVDMLITPRTTFCMTIDNNGNFGGYISINTPESDFGHDMTCDQDRGVFAITCTYSQPTQCASTVIGLLTVTPGLVLTNSVYYYDADHVENYGYSIFTDGPDYFVITGMASDCFKQDPSPSMLKVKSSDLSPIFYTEYNTSQLGRNGYGGSTLCAPSLSGDLEYVMVGNTMDLLAPASLLQSDTRVIRTDRDGEACGRVDMFPVKVDFNEGVDYPFYVNDDIGVEMNYAPQRDYFHVSNYDCDDPIFSEEKKLIISPDETNSQDESIQIFPTSLANGIRSFQISGTDLKACRMEILSATGQQVFAERLAGDINTVSTNDLSSGIYFVVVKDNLGEILKIQKLNIIQ